MGTGNPEPCLRIAAIGLFTLLAGCATPRSPDSPYYPVPVGSLLLLERPLTVPGPGVGVWVQDGSTERGVTRWRPACRLELWTRADEDRTVQPDRFEVTRVVQNITEVAVPSPFVRAHNGGSAAEGGPMAYAMETFLYLRSERQPDVYRLFCQRWDDPRWRQPISINEIRATLAPLFRLDLPAQ